MARHARELPVGRYASLFGVIERCIHAEVLELARDCLFGDQVALEALVQRSYTPPQQQTLRDTIVKAYRWQHIVSGVKHGQFVGLLAAMCTPAQLERIQSALRPLLG